MDGSRAMPLYLKLALLVTLLFTACIGLIHARPADSPLRALLTPPDGCPAPCFMGIRPGVTTLSQAVAILQSSPAVADITRQTTYVDVLRWRWKKPPLDVIDPAVEGRMVIENGVIKEMTIGTTLTFGDVWLLLGPAERGSFMIGALDSPRASAAFHTALYPESSLQVAFVVLCPIRLDEFWRAPILIRWINDPQRYINQRFYLPAWNDRSCQ